MGDMIDYSKVTWEMFLEALLRKEGRKLPDGSWAIGDNGKAIGPFQIHRCYWQDSRVKFPYEDCAELEPAKKTVAGYMNRWEKLAFQNINAGCASSYDVQALARAHNAGWNWRVDPQKSKKKSEIYWEKFREILETILDGK